MKVKINKDELYPVYEIEESDYPGCAEIDLSQDEIAMIEAAGAVFYAAQRLIASKINE